MIRQMVFAGSICLSTSFHPIKKAIVTMATKINKVEEGQFFWRTWRKLAV